MDQVLIDNWNLSVKRNDIVYHLGDVSFYNRQKTKEIISQLNGYKILILGNHDRGRSVSFWKDVGFYEVYTKPIRLDYFYYFSHEPVILEEKYDDLMHANYHGHLHSKNMKDRRYTCLSVEQIDYKPISLEELKERLIKRAAIKRAIEGD